MGKVTAEQTANKYHGRKAETYDAIRVKQERWHLENAIVSRYLVNAKGPLLDVPVGTGRYLPLYAQLRIKNVTGIDSSESMVKLAKRKNSKCKANLLVGSAYDLGVVTSKTFKTAVVVRFLDLIPWESVHRAMTQLSGVVNEQIVLTIRLGEKAVTKSNTATHADKDWKRLLARLGWVERERTPVFRAGWYVIDLRRAR